MIKVLKRVENALLPMLENEDAWSSLDIHYHAPFVERVWLQMKVDDTSYRVNLHKILPCERKDVLFHPHPWPSAMRVVSGGEYEMAVGAQDDAPYAPTIATTIWGRQGMAYEMTNGRAWHYVRPIEQAAYTLMVTGPLYEWQNKAMPVTGHPEPAPGELGPLPDHRVKNILKRFKQFYTVRNF